MPLGRTSGPGPGGCAHKEPRHHCWGERAELVVGEERGAPEQGVGGRNGLNWVCTWGEDGAQSSGAASLQKQPHPPLPAGSTPTCISDHLPALSLTPAPPWVSFLRGLESLQSRGRPGAGSERRSPFSFHTFCPEASSPTSASAPAPGCWSPPCTGAAYLPSPG